VKIPKLAATFDTARLDISHFRRFYDDYWNRAV
jgi:hypothetical protein